MGQRVRLRPRKLGDTPLAIPHASPLNSFEFVSDVFQSKHSISIAALLSYCCRAERMRAGGVDVGVSGGLSEPNTTSPRPPPLAVRVARIQSSKRVPRSKVRITIGL
jgi:hypothetical protein